MYIILFYCSFSMGQDVMMQGWYWDYPKTANSADWSDTLSMDVMNFANTGITHMWLPPFSRASSGSYSNGYDPKDLYDLGEYGGGATGFSTRAKLDLLIASLTANNIEAVADVVYNHRDGGAAENNPAVEGWIENMNCTKISNGDNPFPSDRVRFVLPIGGNTGNGAGIYYIKIASASKHPNFYDLPYTFYAETNTTGYQGMPALTENEGSGNGGGDCGQGGESIGLGIDMNCTIDNVGNCGGFCGVDEFALSVSASDFNASGDSIYIYLRNSSGYSDHYIYGIWNGSADVQSDLLYQTYTDFTGLPSGQGEMNYTNFKPNGNPTNLGGDWDAMLFFYDYDQGVSSTKDVLIDWTEWLWDDVGIRGLRMDAVKHFDYSFVGELMDSLHSVDKIPTMIVGEFFDFNAGALKGWVDNVNSTVAPATQEDIKLKVFDFALRSSLKEASDAFGYDVRNVFNSGIVNGEGADALMSVTFANNHDFRGPGEPIQNDPLLAYAYLLTNRTVGTPTLFYPDYAGTSIPNAPQQEMKHDIDRLIATYNTYMHSGSMDYLSRFSSPYTINFISGFPSTSLIYQTSNGGADGMSDAVVAINYAGDTLEAYVPMSFDSNKSTGSVFKETTGKGLIPETIVDGNNYIRISVPPRSYGIYVSSSSELSCSDSIVYVDINSTGLNNGNSWENAFTHLESAVSQASICDTIKEIWVKEGTYAANLIENRDKGFILPEGITLRGGFPAIGSPDITSYDPIVNRVILSGDIGILNNSSDNVYTVLKTIGTDTTKIYGVYLEGGNGNGSNIEQQIGGGFSTNSTSVLIDCTISNCSASLNGNGLFVRNGGNVLMENCTIENNTGSPTDIFLETGGKIISNGILLGN